MSYIETIKACSTLGELTLDLIEKVLNEDLTSKMDIVKIQVLRASDGKSLLLAGLNHIEISYECFSHPVCVWGEDNKPLFVTAEGDMVNDRPYVQRRETKTVGDAKAVDDYLASRKDTPVIVQVYLRSEHLEETRRMAEYMRIYMQEIRAMHQNAIAS